MKKQNQKYPMRKSVKVEINDMRIARFLKLKTKQNTRLFLRTYILLSLLSLFWFPVDVSVLSSHPEALHQAQITWIAMLLFYISIPFFLFKTIAGYRSHNFIFNDCGSNIDKIEQNIKIKSKLPPIPKYEEVFQFCLGEMHDKKTGDQIENPTWAVISAKDLSQNIFIMGMTGSGKTAALLYPAVNHLMAYKRKDERLKTAFFCLDVKGDFYKYVAAMAARHGREKDLVILEITPNPKWAYNPFIYYEIDDSVMADTIQIVQSAMEKGDGGGGGNDAYWKENTKNLIVATIGLLRLRSLFESDINDVISDKELWDGRYFKKGYFTFIDIDDVISDKEVREGYFKKLVDLAMGLSEKGFMKRPSLPSNAEGNNYNSRDVKKFLALPFDESREEMFLSDHISSVLKYWFGTFKGMEDEDGGREINIFKSMFNQIAAQFKQPTLRPVFCPTLKELESGEVKLINFKQLIDEGLLFVQNIPFEKYKSVATAVGGFLKEDFFRTSLLRITDENKIAMNQDRRVLFLIDEYQVFATSNDQEFFSRSRQSKVVGMVATQQISSLKSAIGESSLGPLLGNLGNKISLLSSEKESSETFAKLGGEETITTESASLSSDGGVGASKSISLSTQMQGVLEDSILQTLRPNEILFIRPNVADRIYAKPYYLRADVDWFSLGSATMDKETATENDPKYYGSEKLPEWTLFFHEGDNFLFSPNPYIRLPLEKINKIFNNVIQKRFYKK